VVDYECPPHGIRLREMAVRQAVRRGAHARKARSTGMVGMRDEVRDAEDFSRDSRQQRNAMVQLARHSCHRNILHAADEYASTRCGTAPRNSAAAQNGMRHTRKEFSKRRRRPPDVLCSKRIFRPARLEMAILRCIFLRYTRLSLPPCAFVFQRKMLICHLS